MFRLILCRRCHIGNPLLSLENEQTQSNEMKHKPKDINASKELKDGYSKNANMVIKKDPKYDASRRRILQVLVPYGSYLS